MNVLLPTDFSENSKHAINYTLQLFKNKPCKLYFLHTHSPIINSPELEMTAGLVGQDFTQLELDSAKKRLEDFALFIMQNDSTGHEFKTMVNLNYLSNEIDQLSEQLNIDLVVMGTKGATSSADVIFGTHTTHVINKRCCPVIAVPETFNFTGLSSVFFPTDLNIDFKANHLQIIKQLAMLHNSNLSILHIAFRGLKTQQKEHLSILKEELKEIDYGVTITEDKDIADAVYEYQNNNNTDLLVMVNNKHLFFENLFFRPTISKIAMHLKTPFLVIPA